MASSWLSFRGWLAKQRKVDSPIGDLARDVAEDDRCWRGRTAVSLWEHLETEHGATVHASIFQAYRVSLEAYLRTRAKGE